MDKAIDGRPIVPRKERQELRAIEGRAAMALYKKADQHRRDNLAKLRTERLEREMADNKKHGDHG